MSTRSQTRRPLAAVVAGAAVTLLVLKAGAAQVADALLDQPGVPYRVDVDLARLSVTARTARGAPVLDLTQEDFQVFEDGVAQDVAHFSHQETPISVVVLLDKSTSMSDEKLMHAKDAVKNFVRALRRQDEVLIVAFSDSVDAIGSFGLDVKTIERAIKKIRVESGTRLYDAVLEGAQAIATPGRKEKRAILILSDGEDTSSGAKLDEAVEAVRRAGVPVYAIGIELDDDPPWRLSLSDPLRMHLRGPSAMGALERLTEGTGGWTYAITAAKRCKEICLRVADELRSQYLLGYYPRNEVRDGRWRTITLRTIRSGVTLATRVGYYAPPSP